MKIFIASLIVFVLALIAMAVGVILRGRSLQGSCGGLGGFTDEKGNTICDACTRPSPDCAGEPVESAAEDDRVKSGR